MSFRIDGGLGRLSRCVLSRPALTPVVMMIVLPNESVWNYLYLHVVWAWKALESIRNTLRIADVIVVESFEVRILVVAAYCTRIYHAKSPESMNAKTTAAERYFDIC